MIKQHRLRPTVVKTRNTHQKNFEIALNETTATELSYFVRQELGYYNTLVEKLTPRLRAYPQDLLSIKDREKRLWEACAEYAVDPQKLIDHPLAEWPAHLHTLHSYMYDQSGQLKVTQAHINIFGIAASPARLHASVRKAMSTEILKYMIGQAETVLAAMKTETMKTPLQMLQQCTMDNKRHLQIPAKLVTITYDADTESSHIQTPYSRNPIIVPYVDLRENTFKMLVIRAPHPTSSNQKWQIDLKDTPAAYNLGLTDYTERKKK